MRSLHPLTTFHSPFPPMPKQMSQSQTPGLDTLAEGSQYALEQLQLAREVSAPSRIQIAGSSPADSHPPQHTQNLLYSERHKPSPRLKDLQSRDSLAEARSSIRKNSSETSVRRRISRACDQCNQLRTKCDGQNPCAHCVGMRARESFLFPCACQLTDSRVFINLRVRPPAQEARESVEKRHCCN